MQHPRQTRFVYYLYFLNITNSVYIHLMSVYCFEYKIVIVFVISINQTYIAGEGNLCAISVRAGIYNACSECPSSCREFWDISLSFYCNSSSVVFSFNRIGATTARVTRVQTLPTLGTPTWTRPIFCSKVLIHYYLDATIFSTSTALLSSIINILRSRRRHHYSIILAGNVVIAGGVCSIFLTFLRKNEALFTSSASPSVSITCIDHLYR